MVLSMNNRDTMFLAFVGSDLTIKQREEEKREAKRQLRNITPELENTITHTYGAIDADCEEIDKDGGYDA